MSGDKINLVCLYKCKHCGTRLYEQDAIGHLERHGFTNPLKDWRQYFTKGKKDQPDKPGDKHQPIYRKTAKANKKEPVDVTLN